MDRFELCFDAVWETGYWYEQVIRRLGGCTVVQHFLVLCGLGEDTTLRELAIAIYGPYLLARSNFIFSCCFTAEKGISGEGSKVFYNVNSK